jgi:hypothetical protein
VSAIPQPGLGHFPYDDAGLGAAYIQNADRIVVYFRHFLFKNKFHYGDATLESRFRVSSFTFRVDESASKHRWCNRLASEKEVKHLKLETRNLKRLRYPQCPLCLRGEISC